MLMRFEVFDKEIVSGFIASLLWELMTSHPFVKHVDVNGVFKNNKVVARVYWFRFKNYNVIFSRIHDEVVLESITTDTSQAEILFGVALNRVSELVGGV